MGCAGGAHVVRQMRAHMMYEIIKRGAPFEQAYHEVDGRLWAQLQPDDRDVNDLHRQGALEGWLECQLKEIE